MPRDERDNKCDESGNGHCGDTGFTPEDRRMLRSLYAVVTGGQNWEGGLLNRTARLEQSQKAAAWWMRSALTAAIGAIVLAAWNAITKGQQHP